MKKVILIVLLSFIFIKDVSACGVLVSDPGTNVRAEHMLTALYWDSEKQREDLIIKIHYLVNEGNVNSLGWIMPFPSPPEMELSNMGFFDQLYQLTEKKKNWLEKAALPELSRGNGKKGDGAASPGTVQVMDRQELGIYRMATVKASDLNSLQEWAEQNNYTIPWKGSKELQEYIKQGWFFVLMNLNESKSVQEGDIRPVRFTFHTKKPVYPLRLASLNRQGIAGSSKTIPITLYLLSKGKIAPVDPYYQNMTQEYGGRLSQQTVESLYLPTKDPLWISRWHGILTADQIHQDLWIESKPDLDELGSGHMNGAQSLQFIWTLLSGGIWFALTMFQMIFMLSFQNEMVGKWLLAILFIFAIGWGLKNRRWGQILHAIIILHGIGAFLLIFYYKQEPLLVVSQFGVVACIVIYFLIRWYRKSLS